jgi:Zn-dependent protease with chaperone function
MHFFMVLITLGLAWWVRSSDLASTHWFATTETWNTRWYSALSRFLFPPLLLFTTGIAILDMGPHGQMVWRWEGWLSYWLAIAFLTAAILVLQKLFWEGWKTLQKTRACAQIDLAGNPARLLETPTLYSAQVGFWQPELVVSRGLLEQVDRAHLEAVLIHEQAHAHYHDTFWFFWLGWLRRLTFWLPQTEMLWQELLALRELRADAWAGQRVDRLLLAEVLLQVVSTAALPEPLCAAFANRITPDRLSQRIEALLVDSEPIQHTNFWSWSWLLLTLVPFAAIPFHS